MGVKKLGQAEAATTRPDFVSCFQPRADKFVDDDLELRIVVTGSPSPEITWKHNGQTMNENNPRYKFLDGSRRLVVRMLTQDDAGTYSCVLKNDAGEITKSCNLTVKAHPYAKKPEFIEQPEDIYALEGSDAEFTCLLPYSRFVLHGSCWIKNGQEVRETGRTTYKRAELDDEVYRETLTISNVQLEDHGSYTLRAANMYGSVRSREVHLYVV